MTAATGLVAIFAFFTPSVAAAESAQSAQEVTAAQLKAADRAVLKADIAGTAWVVDEEAGKVVVEVDERVTAADIAKIKRTAGASAITIERIDGRFETYMRGGDAIYANTGWRCSLGFNVRVNGLHAFLTAGHCTSGTSQWHNGSQWIGATWHTYFPGRDHGLVQYQPQASHRSVVNMYNGTTRAITSVGNAFVGQRICRSGSTTGVRCGTVTALNQSVNYGGGQIVNGLIRTNACAEGGDSGGSMFTETGNVGLGMTSGGSGNCTVGGTTFFEPLPRAMSYYGAVLNN
jgi:streptogrisin B